MNIALWIVQVLLAVVFVFHGVIKLAPPPDLPAQIQWIYDMAPGLRTFVGTVELLAAIGLILPGVTKIQPRLTPLAALGLMILMVGGVVFHIPRGEFEAISINVFVFILSAFVAYGRWRVRPLQARTA